MSPIGKTNMRPPPYTEPAKYSPYVLGALDASGTYDDKHEVALSFGGQALPADEQPFRL